MAGTVLSRAKACWQTKMNSALAQISPNAWPKLVGVSQGMRRAERSVVDQKKYESGMKEVAPVFPPPVRQASGAEGSAKANYWSSLVTSCCMELAWARAEMPVWLRIWYLDMLEVAEA